MAKNKDIKTNAMRILEKNRFPYHARFYECSEFTDAGQIADLLELPHRLVYKTLVTQGAGREYYVFVIPIDSELDLKAAAASVGEKSVSMLHVKDIFTVTGYVRGGCTPVGMKKQFVTRIDSSAQVLESIIVSGGKIGVQIELAPEHLLAACGGEYADLTK